MAPDSSIKRVTTTPHNHPTHMKYKSPIAVACMAALAVCLPITVSAQSKSASPGASASPAASAAAASPAAMSSRPLPFYGTISSVDQSAKTFTITGKETSRVFKITDRSVITKEGNPATMTEIAANDAVRGSYWKQADGTLEIKTAKLGEKTDAEKEAKKSKKDDTEDGASASPSASPSPKK